VSTTAQLLGTGAAGTGQPGVLAAAGAAVKAAPDAAKEFDRTVVLPAVKEFAQGVVLVAKDAQQQVGGSSRGTLHLGCLLLQVIIWVFVLDWLWIYKLAGHVHCIGRRPLRNNK